MAPLRKGDKVLVTVGTKVLSGVMAQDEDVNVTYVSINLITKPIVITARTFRHDQVKLDD